ncbi:MAG: hypothetical protein ACODAE_10995 [Gemmatimonadota bacterium]
MKRTSTKRAAEAILGELPSVLGAYVREDVHGHPREVHLLIGPKPNARVLSHDVRDLLEERLGVPVDQRVISIAQVSASTGQHATVGGGATDGGHRTAPAGGRSAADRYADPATRAETSRRLIYTGLESGKQGHHISVRVRLHHDDEEYVGEAEEMDAGTGRMRAAARATLNAVSDACDGDVGLDLEAASTIEAFGREYALVAVLARSPMLGRQPVSLAGAHSAEAGAEVAAIFACLKATNRIVSRALGGGRGGRGRRGG